MNLLTRLFALHFDRSFSGKGWRQLAWLFGVIVTVFLLIYLVSFAFIFPEPSLEGKRLSKYIFYSSFSLLTFATKK